MFVQAKYDNLKDSDVTWMRKELYMMASAGYAQREDGDRPSSFQ